MPEQPENRDLIHFFKGKKGWEFITKEEYN